MFSVGTCCILPANVFFGLINVAKTNQGLRFYCLTIYVHLCVDFKDKVIIFLNCLKKLKFLREIIKLYNFKANGSN